MVSISSEVDRLLSVHVSPLPLVRSALHPNVGACGMRAQNAANLFPGARSEQAALAGLLLRVGCWEESHLVAQDITAPEGSYWHSIIHRMEPDPFNAGYWARRIGKHPIFPELLRRTAEILANGGPAGWRPKALWDPLLFIEWCEEAREKGGQAESAAVEIQMAEWELLFNWCAAKDAEFN